MESVRHLAGSQRNLLYVDGLNYAEEFFPRDGSFWKLEEAQTLVNEFARAASHSGWHVEIFIDAGMSTKEARDKWHQRREDDVRLGTLGMPPGLQYLLGTMYSKAGLKVHYSSVDNDDTLAAYATAHGACVMSEDKDFFRYRNSKFTVFNRFEIVGDKLKLHKRDFLLHGSPRTLDLENLPSTYDIWPSILRLFTEERIYKGTPSPLTKIFGNLHGHIKELRRQYYFEIGIPLDKSIKEKYPQWDKKSKSVQWVEEDVTPNNDTYMKSLLYDPFTAISAFFSDYLDGETIKKPDNISTMIWHNHFFSCCYVILELNALLLNLNIVQLML